MLYLPQTRQLPMVLHPIMLTVLTDPETKKGTNLVLIYL